MGQYDLFRKIAQSSLTSKEREVATIKCDILSDFESSPSFEIVTVSGISKGVHITDESSLNKNPNKKRISMKPGETISVGDIVTWNTNSWLVTDLDSDNGIYYVGVIERCNIPLKWLNNVGKIIEYPCISTDTTMYSLGIEENKQTPIPDGKALITLPNNADTLKIIRNQRFILYNNFAYHVTFINMAISGLIKLILNEDEPNWTIDNQQLGIANYYNAPKYQIQIREDDISITIGTVLQLHAIVSKDGIVVEDQEVEWSSSNTLTSTVDSNGKVIGILGGNANIVAKLKENNAISDSILCNVRNVPVPNIDFAIEGDSEISWTVEKSFKAVKLLNGIEQPLSYNFTIDYQGNNAKIVTLVSTGINTCTITANSEQITGEIILKATNKVNPNEFVTKNINIIGFW
jgi:hypothetical protein